MLELWQAIGYSEIFSDTIVDDPNDRLSKCRVERAVLRDFALNNRMQARGSQE